MRKLSEVEELGLGQGAPFHVTETILNKNIMDCNQSMRRLLKETGVVDMDHLSAGEKVVMNAQFADGSETQMSLYRANGRGDKRVWFSKLKYHSKAGDMMALVYEKGQLVVKNLTTGAFVCLVYFSSNAPINLVNGGVL